MRADYMAKKSRKRGATRTPERHQRDRSAYTPRAHRAGAVEPVKFDQFGEMMTDRNVADIYICAVTTIHARVRRGELPPPISKRPYIWPTAVIRAAWERECREKYGRNALVTEMR